MIKSLLIICFFTAFLHLSQTLAFVMRLAGLRTKQIAISMAFVTTTLLVSRLSNMFMAPVLGAMVDGSILIGSQAALDQLVFFFRLIIFSGFLGVFIGMILTPTAVYLFEKAIKHFLIHGSIPKIMILSLRPKNIYKIFCSFRLPKFSMLKTISLKDIPKQFLILNIFVASIYTVGVLCSLLAGAYLPEMRSTAIQLSGIVNGIATILLTVFVDPAGARITDQAAHNNRSENDVRSVVFYLQFGKLIGTLIIAQILLVPFSKYILYVTGLISRFFIG